MQTRNRNAFTTIHTEGALLPVDLLQRISDGNASLVRLEPEDYHLVSDEKLNEIINCLRNRMNGLWGVFKTVCGRLGIVLQASSNMPFGIGSKPNSPRHSGYLCVSASPVR